MFILRRVLILLHLLPRLQPLRWSRGSSFGIATGYELDDRGVGFRVPVSSRISLLHVVQTDSEGHPASYLKGIGGSFPRG
jgi:hypothetical protein